MKITSANDSIFVLGAPLNYDPDDPLAVPSSLRQPRREMSDPDLGLGTSGEDWRRFRLLHPEGHDDNAGIVIAVRHHGDAASPWDNGKYVRPHFEWRVGSGEGQVMPSKEKGGGGYPFWGSAIGYKTPDTDHREVAQTVASLLAGDARDIDTPLHQREMYMDGMTEENYPWSVGKSFHEWPAVATGNGAPYSDSEKEFLRNNADRLHMAGREDGYFEDEGPEHSTLVEEQHPSPPASTRYGSEQ